MLKVMTKRGGMGWKEGRERERERVREIKRDDLL